MRKSIFILLGKVFRKKVILHIHSSKFYEFFLSSNFFLSEYCSFIFRYSDLIIVLCNDWKKKLEQKYNLKNVLVLYNPIEIGDVHSRKIEKKNELLILFLGFLIESKGIKDIISLAKKFEVHGNTGIKIAVAGKGDLESFLIKAISDNYLTQIIDFKGWVTGKDKNQLLSSGDVFFLPSYKEGMPISVLEAMANSLPIVATEIAGIPDLVKQGRNGYLFQPGDIDGYYRCFLQLQNNKEKVVKMGLESWKIVKSFDADLIFNRLVHIYQSVK